MQGMGLLNKNRAYNDHEYHDNKYYDDYGEEEKEETDLGNAYDAYGEYDDHADQ